MTHDRRIAVYILAALIVAVLAALAAAHFATAGSIVHHGAILYDS